MNRRLLRNRCFLNVQKCLTFLLLFCLCVQSIALSSLLSFKSVYAAEAVLTQTHFHWRSDNGSEVLATSLTNGAEDTSIGAIARETPLRLRLSVSNEGTLTSSSTVLQLQYGTKVTQCSEVAVWVSVGDTNAAWDMYDSSHVTDGANTTNIAESNGGVTDENNTFLTPNAALKDTSSSVATTALASTQFIEAEFSIQQTELAAYGTTYCFRLSNASVPLDAYNIYPEVTTEFERDFVVQRGTLMVDGVSETITAGVDYQAPASTSSAFIRITNSHHTGAGKDADGGTQRPDDVTVSISNPENLASSVTFTRPSTGQDNTRVSWEIVEYVGIEGADNEIIVRDQGTVTYDVSSLVATGTSVGAIADDSDVVVFITGQENPDTSSSDYNTGASTAHWSFTDNSPVFTRGEANGDAVTVSYAIVEFTGANWRIQRAEHAYTASGVTETENITPVNSLVRTFIHTQKRVGNGLSGTDEFGHEVWLSSIGAVSFFILEGATNPADQVSVAWVIENTQTGSGAMEVTRSSGSSTGGDEPLTQSVAIGETVSDISLASIFANTAGAGIGAAYPRPIAGFTIASTTHYEIWRSDTGTQLDYRVEVVQWPTTQLSLNQNDYRFYVDDDSLDPADPWPAGVTDLGENTVLTESDEPLKTSERIRMRMSMLVENATFPRHSKSFKLQFGERTSTCSAIGEASWHDVGAIDSSAIWRGYDALSIADGTALSSNPPTAGDLKLAVSDVAGTYEESNSSAINPYAADMGTDIEYDWLVEQNGAPAGTFYCFRMVEQNGAVLGAYTDYPQLRTASFTPVSKSWRWYDDAENSTPVVALAGESAAPTDIQGGNAIKLRVTIEELSNMSQDDTRFKLQYSEDINFTSAYDVVSTTTCVGSSAWCYYNGGGDDHAVITDKVLSDSDACSLSLGAGCGTHNEGAHPVSGFTHVNGTAVEYEFSIVPQAPQINTVYYFRIYNVTADAPVTVSGGASYPSLVTEGSLLVFTISGMPAGTTTESYELDASSTPNSIEFGSVPFGTGYEAAHRLSVDTNAVEGYQVLMFSDQQLQSSFGSSIEPILGSNALPVDWKGGCPQGQYGCFGYHAGDDSLQGVSPARFGADDSFAALSTEPQEVMYSSIPANDTHDIVYKIQVQEDQPAGTYQTNVTYIAVPVF